MCLIGSNSEMLLGCCQGRASAGASVVTFCLLWLEHVGTWNSNHHGQEAKHFQSASKILIILQAQGQTGLQDPKNVYYYILLSILLSIYLYIYNYIYGVWCPLQMFAASGTLACEARAELVAAQYAGSSAAKHCRAPDVIWCNNIIWRNYIRSPGARW